MVPAVKPPSGTQSASLQQLPGPMRHAPHQCDSPGVEHRRNKYVALPNWQSSSEPQGVPSVDGGLSPDASGPPAVLVPPPPAEPPEAESPPELVTPPPGSVMTPVRVAPAVAEFPVTPPLSPPPAAAASLPDPATPPPPAGASGKDAFASTFLWPIAPLLQPVGNPPATMAVTRTPRMAEVITALIIKCLLATASSSATGLAPGRTVAFPTRR
jgi:hypothetical protein